MHINKVYLKKENLWVSYDLETVNEKIRLNATFIKDGIQIHKVRNLGSFKMLCKLKDRESAIAEAKKIIESANRSKDSPFLK